MTRLIFGQEFSTFLSFQCFNFWKSLNTWSQRWLWGVCVLTATEPNPIDSLLAYRYPEIIKTDEKFGISIFEFFPHLFFWFSDNEFDFLKNYKNKLGRLPILYFEEISAIKISPISIFRKNSRQFRKYLKKSNFWPGILNCKIFF